MGLDNMLRQKLTTSKLEKEAPFYKYDETGMPQSFLDVREFSRYLRSAEKKEIQHVLIKIGVIKHLLFKRYYEIKRDLEYMAWIEQKKENGWKFQYSRPRYRDKFTNTQKQKDYSDAVMRHSKITNINTHEERYAVLKKKYNGSGEKIPPAMAGLGTWRNYFTYTINLNELQSLDKCLVEILVSYEESKKHSDDGRQTALDYLRSRRKYTQSEIDEGAK
jgi:hypothetical protein